MVDRYTKFILTVIAVCLVGLLFKSGAGKDAQAGPAQDKRYFAATIPPNGENVLFWKETANGVEGHRLQITRSGDLKSPVMFNFYRGYLKE